MALVKLKREDFDKEDLKTLQVVRGEWSTNTCCDKVNPLKILTIYIYILSSHLLPLHLLLLLSFFGFSEELLSSFVPKSLLTRSMAQRANVPKFGNWGSEDNTPYTVVFENARKNRGGKMINPNDPQENPDMFPNIAPPSRPKTPTEESMGTNKRRVSREDGEFRANSPVHNEAVTHQRHGGSRGSNSGRPARQSGGSDHSIAKSPLHPNSHEKISGRVAASPVWEGKNSYDSSHGTPGRSFESAHATPGRYPIKQESPDRGTVVPKFGGWDDNDPQDAENYTEVFNKVREQRHVDSGNMPSAGGRTSYSTQRHQQKEKQKSCCCPWW